ncbi:Ras-like GTP-binding [Brachionus plicatilis]|uniref:Ras-like GTP-binding n=1 Tax=Brachionus plicatilis TaxID=10195 RepID=A0A3M7QQG4_BRAPC|nr:Ras-like GTP-binding [Brachionus plicatilis]
MSVRKKLVVVGDGACGKTCLLYAFCKDQFLDEYEVTVFETYVTDIEVDGIKIELVLWDTAGQEEYERLRPLSYPDSNVVLVCYSIDNRDSLENIYDKWCPEIKYYCPKIPIILVGNKKDLRLELKRSIDTEEGVKMAEKIGAYGFYECSAKTREGVRDVFETAASASLVYLKPKKSLKSKLAKTKCQIL